MLIALVLELMAAAAGYLIGDHKGRPLLGAVLGFCLGLIGIAIIAVVPSRRRARSADRADRVASSL